MPVLNFDDYMQAPSTTAPLTNPVVRRDRTAMKRFYASRPVRLALADGLINSDTSVFDYGCGHGADLRYLKDLGIDCAGWDPIFAPATSPREADIVNLGYVINVIEEPNERLHVLREAWRLARRLLIVAARLSLEAELPARPSFFSDGFLTSRGTFQKLFDQHELRDFLDSALEVQSVAAAPGVFYIFKDPAEREAYSVSRFARSYLPPSHINRAERLYEEYKQEFNALSEFLSNRGRLPNRGECPAIAALEGGIGSIKRAFAILQKLQSAANWQQIRAKRIQDLSVYLALGRFPKRCKFSELPQDMQLDIRAFWGTYGRACDEADDLLFSAGKQTAIDQACSSAGFGKLTADAIYLHVSILGELPALLRVYEGCARVLVGRIEGANVIKLHRARACVSYLSYPEFDSIAHPPLYGALVVDLTRLRMNYRDYATANNRPILHRKDQFVSTVYEHYPKFARLTRQEEKHGLYDEPHLIGYEEYWNALLLRRGLQITGHRLMRQPDHGHAPT